jgi:hypothetical protein
MAQNVIFPTFPVLVTRGQSGVLWNWRTASPGGVPLNAYGLTTTPGNLLFGGSAGGTNFAIPVRVGRARRAIPLGH